MHDLFKHYDRFKKRKRSGDGLCGVGERVMKAFLINDAFTSSISFVAFPQFRYPSGAGIGTYANPVTLMSLFNSVDRMDGWTILEVRFLSPMETLPEHAASVWFPNNQMVAIEERNGFLSPDYVFGTR